jgi:MoxR-like ATPase
MITKIRKEIHKVIVGQEALIDGMLIALLSGGHILVEGVPGIAKTTAVNTLAKVLGFDFKRIQFTPDLLPADITGSEILDLQHHTFKLKHGPIFTHLLLADEINRAGAKVQSALLEAMAERQVTIGEQSLKLEDPFMVLATANPVEQDGTYELPEASLDRFMLKVTVGYNTIAEEFEIVQRVTQEKFGEVKAVIDRAAFMQLKKELHAIHVEEALSRYMLKLVFATREPEAYGLEELAAYIDFGVSPRGSIDLYKASKARAFLDGKTFVTPSDVAQVAFPVLRHRMRLSYHAITQGITAEDIIRKILEKVPAP